MKVYRIQFAPAVDKIIKGLELTKLPYPFFIRADGKIQSQELWKGDPLEAVGFQRDLAMQQIDLPWEDYAAEDQPNMVVGLYLVTRDYLGGMSVHVHAISEVETWELV